MKKIFFTLFTLAAFSLMGSFAHAQTACPQDAPPGCTNLIVQIPTIQGPVLNPVDYIIGVYRFGLEVGGLLAMAIIVYAGLKRATSAGNAGAISDANDMITNAIWGLVLLFGAFVILNTINPNLTKLSLPSLTPVNTPTSSNVFSNFNELSQPLRTAEQNDLAKAQANYEAAAKIAAETEGIIADRQPDPSKWTPEQKARIAVAQYDQEVALYDVQRTNAQIADLQWNTVYSSICGSQGVTCGNGFVRGATPEQQAALDKATQTRDVTAANAQTTLTAINADSTKISSLRTQYNIQLQQK